MFIKSIIDNDGDDFEYDVIVSDGSHDILCFAYEKFDANSEFILRTWDPQNVKKSNLLDYLLIKEEEYYQYRIRAKVLDMKKDLMSIYGITFIFDGIYPPDVKDGDYIEFTECRMDVLRNIN